MGETTTTAQYPYIRRAPFDDRDSSISGEIGSSSWFMAIIMVLVLILTRNLKIVPGKRQAFLEMAAHMVQATWAKPADAMPPYSE